MALGWQCSLPLFPPSSAATDCGPTYRQRMARAGVQLPDARVVRLFARTAAMGDVRRGGCATSERHDMDHRAVFAGRPRQGKCPAHAVAHSGGRGIFLQLLPDGRPSAGFRLMTITAFLLPIASARHIFSCSASGALALHVCRQRVQPLAAITYRG